LSGLDNEILWEIIKNVRLKCLIENANKLDSTFAYCFAADDRLFSAKTLCWNDFIQELEISGSKHIDYNSNVLWSQYHFTKNQLDVAGEMYIYLNMCPKFMDDWIQLYANIIQNFSPDYIVQALNRIIITGRMKRDATIEDIARKILIKHDKVFSLKFHTIDKLTKVESNDTFRQHSQALNVKINSTKRNEDIVSNFDQSISFGKGISKKYKFIFSFFQKPCKGSLITQFT